MPIKDPEKRKEYMKQYHKNKIDKVKKAEYQRQYRNTYIGRKNLRISNWKRYGVLCFDFDLLYDLFLSTDRCEFCRCELTTDKRTKRTTRCLDHDHNITDRFNVRGVLCNICNITDVLNNNI